MEPISRLEPVRLESNYMRLQGNPDINVPTTLDKLIVVVNFNQLFTAFPNNRYYKQFISAYRNMFLRF